MSKILLAMRPMWIDVEKKKFFTESGHYLPGLQIIRAPCRYHKDTVEENCTCGVMTYFSLTAAINWMGQFKDVYKEMATRIMGIDLTHPYPHIRKIPVIGLMQVLGPAIIYDEDKYIRSAGAFFWGYVMPPYVRRDVFNTMSANIFGNILPPFVYKALGVRVEYNPVVYKNIDDAFGAVSLTLLDYGYIDPAWKLAADTYKGYYNAELEKYYATKDQPA